ncbi:hypothetical protein ASPVEDRAFT_86245 [Aspergillus versicolor CBS 583.65]|uniref:Mid2 domain-containing protein n=1 Tax=Aspergillus versicolor CBS 583.65 TaxID=1036611 RepID=A0A1L9PTM2_ASPVE|nr:uncharacterized protein ASPVEDRAFT_86245 [Aspergillus versicolor CBS 583.65]OJJ04864.1 hypothetical protein ASPVEDRAFT_86245 [Aspergillus versicolor CBS 583.65]
MSGKFTFPTKAENKFIVADLVNITWTVDAPVISLYESCGKRNRILQEEATNNKSYVWTATRKGYVESGCKFKLQPFTAELESYGNNITSALFGVSKRYTSDPSPVSYNFANTTETETETETESSTPSATDLSSEPATTPTSNASHGLSKASKVGIGVGVPLGVLLLSFLIGAFIIYRRRSRRKEIREITATNQPGDAMAPLPTFGLRDPHHTRLSQAETIGTVSQLSSDNQRTQTTERPPSELMATGRAELA